MRYWYDTEFIEDGKTIDLISIGVVAEDGREYYAQNEECKFQRASSWVKANVYPSLTQFEVGRHRPVNRSAGGPDGYARWKRVWRTRAEIASDLRAFCDPKQYGTPELWGYYGAYDHVALCQLFGTMMELPEGWPMYTRDIKQWCDALGNPRLPEQGEGEHNALADARWNKQAWEFIHGWEHDPNSQGASAVK